MENENQNEFEFVEKNTKKTVIIIISIILVILLVGGLGFYLFFLKQTPDNYLDYIKEELTTYVSKTCDKLEDLSVEDNKVINQDGVFTIKTDSEDLKLLNNYKVEFNSKYQISTNKMITNLKLLEKDKKFLESSLYSEAQTFYIKLTDLYDKFIKVEPKIENNKKINLKKIDKNINTLIEAYLDALKEAKTSGKNVGFTKVKYTYEITSSNQEKVINKFKEVYDNNKDLQELVEIEDFKSLFEIAKIEITINRFNKQIYSLAEIGEGYKLKIEKDLDLDKYNIIENGEKIGTLKIIDNEITIEYINKEKIDYSLTFKNLTDGIEFDFNDEKNLLELSIRDISDTEDRLSLKYKNEEDKVDLDIDGSIKEVADKKECSILTTINVSEEKIQVDYKGALKLTTEEIELPDFTNSVDVKDLQEKDYNSILEKLAGKLLTSNLLSSIMGLDSKI